MRIPLYITIFTACALIAQDQPELSATVTINPMVDDVIYCLGPTSYLARVNQPGESDVTLQITLKLTYENRGTQPIIVPLRYDSVDRMRVNEEPGARIVGNFRNWVGLQEAAAGLSHPMDAEKPTAGTAPPFIVIPPHSSEGRYLGEALTIRVRGPEKDLLGKTLHFSVERDHLGSTPQSVADALQEKWKKDGVLWLGSLNSGEVALTVPDSPETVDCRKLEQF